MIIHGFAPAPDPLVVEVKRKPSDKNWRKNKTTVLDHIEGFTPSAMIALNPYGGRTDRRLRVTGYFHVEKRGQRWQMVDPDGCAWYQIGCNSVQPNRTERGTKALLEKYGTREAWAAGTASQLRSLGFNMLGCWSDWKTFRASSPMPYTTQSNFMQSFGKTLGVTHQASGHAGYEGNVIPVFDPRFPDFCREHAQKCLAANRDDPWLVGHFSDNEMPLSHSFLDRCLKLPQSHPNHAAARAWLKANNVDSHRIPGSAKASFLSHAAATYFEHVSSAIRAADPNHLYLGCGFHGSALRNRAIWEAAGRHVDVVSVNWYGCWTPDTRTMDNWATWSKRPFVITEWYAKGMDSGMANNTGAGWTVKTQTDRGWFYQNFTIALARHPSCVGWHWFKYMDNDPTNTKADPSNRDSNKGYVNYLYEPYADLMARMEQLNRAVYPLIDFFEK
jgi:hypothetical protein